MNQSLIRTVALLFGFTIISFGNSFAADGGAGACNKLPAYENLDCKNSTSVLKALNELHSCMKSRFTYKDVVYAEAWPLIDVAESGPIVGGDGEWSVACVEAWPCKDSRLAFVEEMDKLPHLVMVSKTFIVDQQLDKVYDKKDLKKHKMLKVSGLKPDEAWFKVDLE